MFSMKAGLCINSEGRVAVRANHHQNTNLEETAAYRAVKPWTEALVPPRPNKKNMVN